MFSIKRLMSLGLMLLMFSTMFVFTTGVASARTASPALAAASCYNTSCDGKSPISTSCDSTAVTEWTATSADLGGGLKATAYLRFSTACQAAWAKVVFNKPIPSGSYGNATITRSDGKSISCISNGGNGDVMATQTSCYSAMVGDAGGYYARAKAQYDYGGDSFITVATTASYYSRMRKTRQR